MNIKRNIELILNEIGNRPARLIVVSKTQSIEKIAEAYEAGQRIFGENKVQEMGPKQEALPKDIEWHMIGHLQSNKIKYIAPYVSLIHSVDSEKLADEINKEGKKNNRVIPCLLQVHVATEETKFGFDRSEVLAFLQGEKIKAYTHLSVRGLMGMASLTKDENQVRSEFAGLKKLFEELKSSSLPASIEMKELSMGMSSDYMIALEEGSTFVRIGTAVFGERTAKIN